MNERGRSRSVVFLLLTLLGLAADAGAQVRLTTDAGRRLDQLQGGLYSAVDSTHASVVLVTADGIVVAGVPNRAFALWLKDELARMFPSLSVTHVLLSHYEFDRLDAASVFAESATLIAHPSYAAAVTRSLPSFTLQARLAARVQAYRVNEPLAVGGSTISFTTTPLQGARDATVVWFAREGVAFAMDAPDVDRDPFSVGDLPAIDVRRWFEAMQSLPFAYLVTGTGVSVPKDAIIALGDGAALPRRRSAITQPRPIVGPALYGAATVSGVARGANGGCPNLSSCSPNDIAFGGIGGWRASRTPIELAVELRVGRAQRSQSRVSNRLVETFTVPYQLSGLARWSPASLMRFGLAALTGPTLAADVNNPSGRDPWFVTHVGWTAGLDISGQIGPRLQIFVPLRFTQMTGGDVVAWPSNQSLQIGLGFTVAARRLPPR